MPYEKLKRGQTQGEILQQENTMFNELYTAVADLEQSFDEMVSNSTVFTATKDNLTTSDSEVISNYFQTSPDPAPKPYDIFVIRTVVSEVDYELSSYIYFNSNWQAITGNVDADKVILRENITLAGNYTQIGNLTKSQNGTSTVNSAGMSVADFIKQITTATLQPSTPTQPAVSGFSLSNAGAKEAGTQIPTTTFGTAVLSAGSYQFGPPTGITAQSYSIDRVCNPSSMSQTGIVSAASGTDNNGGAGFIIGDQGGANVVSSLQYKVTVTYNAGAIANDNIGGQSNPPVQIAAGSKSQTTASMTPFRNYFYGAVSTSSPLSGSSITSDLIRSLTPAGAYSKGVKTVNVPAGSTAVYIACLSTNTGVTKVINTSSLNADVTSTFIKQQNVMVEGANGYTAVSYNVWYFIPEAPYGNAAALEVTLG